MYSQTGHRWKYNMGHAHRMLGNQDYKHTLRICNVYCFCSTTMVARTRHNVMLYVHFLSCYNGDCSHCAIEIDSGTCRG